MNNRFLNAALAVRRGFGPAVSSWVGLLASLAFALPLATGCGSQTCTLIGCDDGVEVSLEPSVVSTYGVEIVVDGVAGSFTCTEVGGGWSLDNEIGDVPLAYRGCSGDGFTVEGTPATLEISVTAQDGSWTGAVASNPTYQSTQPNGPGCGPICEIAEVTVE